MLVLMIRHSQLVWYQNTAGRFWQTFLLLVHKWQLQAEFVFCFWLSQFDCHQFTSLRTSDYDLDSDYVTNENQSCFPRIAMFPSMDIEILGEQNSLFPKGLVI